MNGDIVNLSNIQNNDGFNVDVWSSFIKKEYEEVLYWVFFVRGNFYQQKLT